MGQQRDEATGAVVPPIHVASTFVQHEAGKWREFDYSRSGNPTRKNLEIDARVARRRLRGTGLRQRHGGYRTASSRRSRRATTSSRPRISTAEPTDCLHKVTDRAGIKFTHVDTTNVANVAAAITPATRLVWIESPGNPLMSITDIAACADVAHQRGALLAVDNTFASPVLTRPLELGADVVMHSATKYLGGHSDLLGGALVVRDQTLLEKLYFVQNATGSSARAVRVVSSARAASRRSNCGSASKARRQ